MEKLQQLKTFEDACKVEGLDAEKVIAGFSALPELDKEPLIACAKLFIITRAANRLENDGQSWTPDWTNYNQYKYTPYFEMKGSSGFRFLDDVHWYTNSYVGSRLCFISSEVATYVGKQFKDIYEQFMVIN